MIRFIQRYRRSLFGVLSLGAVALAMSGFGVRLFAGDEKPHAIKVNKEKIGFGRVDYEKKQIEGRYRQIFGENYGKFAEALRLNLSSQAVDRIIVDTLLDQESERIGLYSGEDSVVSMLREEVFGGEIDRARYAALLRDLEMQGHEFDELLRKAALREQFVNLLQQVTPPTRKEAEAQVQQEKASFSLGVVEFDPASLEPKVVEPTAEELEKFYLDRATQFEIPEKASFDYLVFSPESFAKEVEVSADDIELYYAEHEEEFMTPARVKVKQIQMSYTKGATPKQMAELKDHAEEVRGKIQAGMAFEEAAKLYSDDLLSRDIGGDIGWISPGSLTKRFDKDFENVAFKLKAGEVSDLVPVEYGFHIIKMEEKEEAAVKPLEQVKGEIEEKLKLEEAPAYAAHSAEETYEAWTKAGSSLADFVAATAVTKAGVTLKSSAGLLAKENEVPGYPGLAAKVLSNVELGKMLLELGDKTFLVQVKEHQDSKLPELAALKESVLKIYREESSRRLAKDEAQNLIEEAKNSGELLANKKLKGFKSYQGVTEKEGRSGVLAQSSVAEALKSVSMAPEMLKDAYEDKGKFYAIQVTSISIPDAKEIEAGVKQKLASKDSGMQLVEQLAAGLKAKAVLDVNPRLLATESSG